MAVLHVNLSDPSDVRTGIDILTRHLDVLAQRAHPIQPTAPSDPLRQAVADMRRREVWPFLYRVANLNVPEYSLPELGRHTGLSSNKVCSLKAILAKPEQRLGVQFFELAPTGAVDPSGNPRYRMPEAMKQAIQAARDIQSVRELVDHSEDFATRPKAVRRKVTRWAEYAVRMVWHRTGVPGAFAPRLADAEILNFITLHPRVLRCLKHVLDRKIDEKVKKYLTPGYISGFLFLMGSSGSSPDVYRTSTSPSESLLSWNMWDKACDFWVLLADGGEGMAMVRRALDQLFLSHQGGTPPLDAKLAVIARAWQYYAAGRTITADALRPGDNGAGRLADPPTVGGIDIGQPKAEQTEEVEPIATED